MCVCVGGGGVNIQRCSLFACSLCFVRYKIMELVISPLALFALLIQDYGAGYFTACLICFVDTGL